DDNAGELYLESYDGRMAEKSFALTELYEAWLVLSIRERVEGFKLLQQDHAEDFFLHLSARDKGQLTLALPSGERKLWMRLLRSDDNAGELYLESYDGRMAEKSFALTELYEAWLVLSIRERVEGFKLLQQDHAEDFFLHLSARDKGQLTLALPSGERKLWMRLL